MFSCNIVTICYVPCHILHACWYWITCISTKYGEDWAWIGKTSHKFLHSITFAVKNGNVALVYLCIPNLVTMATHNSLPKWLPWQSISCDMWTISFLARIRNMMKIGLKLTILQSELALFSNIFSKTVFLGTCGANFNLSSQICN